MIAADAELALQKPFLTFVGNKYGLSDDAIAYWTAHSIADFEDNVIVVRVVGLVELLKKSWTEEINAYHHKNRRNLCPDIISGGCGNRVIIISF